MTSYHYCRLRLAIVLSAGLMLSSASARAQPPEARSCDARQEICAFLATYFDAFNTRNWEAFRNTFDDSITVMFDRPGPPERRDGRAAVEALFRRIFPPVPPPREHQPEQLRPEELLVQDLGDAAVVSFHLRGTGEFSRRTLVLQQRNARWRVVHIHASSRDLEKSH